MSTLGDGGDEAGWCPAVWHVVLLPGAPSLASGTTAATSALLLWLAPPLPPPLSSPKWPEVTVSTWVGVQPSSAHSTLWLPPRLEWGHPQSPPPPTLTSPFLAHSAPATLAWLPLLPQGLCICGFPCPEHPAPWVPPQHPSDVTLPDHLLATVPATLSLRKNPPLHSSVSFCEAISPAMSPPWGQGTTACCSLSTGAGPASKVTTSDPQGEAKLKESCLSFQFAPMSDDESPASSSAEE